MSPRLRDEAAAFRLAVQFLTRLPTGDPGFTRARMAASPRYYPPAQPTYYQPQPTYYNNQYYRNDGYTTVTVTNRGQNGYRDDVVQQRVPCGSQYYDGYRQRTARC